MFDFNALLNRDDLHKVAKTFTLDFSDKIDGKEIVKALAENDANKLCIALTGWSAKDLLVRAGIISDEEQVRITNKKGVVVTMIRTRQEGFHVENYTNTFVLVVPENTFVNEDIVRTAAIAATNEFMNTVEGQRAWYRSSEDFNWGDWSCEMPEEILNHHGIYHVGTRPADISVLDAFTWNVNQDEVIGYGPASMEDNAREKYLSEFADMVMCEAVAHINHHQSELKNEEVQYLHALKNAKFMPFFKDCLLQGEQFEEILHAGEDAPAVCYKTFWYAYQAFPDRISANAFED